MVSMNENTGPMDVTAICLETDLCLKWVSFFYHELSNIFILIWWLFKIEKNNQIAFKISKLL